MASESERDRNYVIYFVYEINFYNKVNNQNKIWTKREGKSPELKLL